MSLYRYRKIENLEPREYSNDEIVLDSDTNTGRINAWNTVGGSYGFLQNLVNKSFLANLIIPAFFIVVGIFFIFQYIYPEIKYRLEKSNGLVAQGTTTLIAENYVDVSKFISNPAGLSKVTAQAFSQNILQSDEVSRNYKKLFYISIPSLGINRLPVQPNVDSTTESAYNAVLKNSLAHFENTGLPVSEVLNNIVIYGHSATSNYNPRPTDPEVAFSFLPNLKVGDEITIEMEGKEYKFRMYRSKIVEPTDFSVITGSSNQRTLTLFTCYPPGNNSNRYVAVARPI